MSAVHQSKNARHQQEKSRRARNEARRAAGLHETDIDPTLREKYPHASKEALAFMSKAYKDPAFFAAMQDLAQR